MHIPWGPIYDILACLGLFVAVWSRSAPMVWVSLLLAADHAVSRIADQVFGFDHAAIVIMAVDAFVGGSIAWLIAAVYLNKAAKLISILFIPIVTWHILAFAGGFQGTNFHHLILNAFFIAQLLIAGREAVRLGKAARRRLGVDLFKAYLPRGRYDGKRIS